MVSNKTKWERTGGREGVMELDMGRVSECFYMFVNLYHPIQKVGSHLVNS